MYTCAANGVQGATCDTIPAHHLPNFCPSSSPGLLGQLPDDFHLRYVVRHPSQCDECEHARQPIPFIALGFGMNPST